VEQLEQALGDIDYEILIVDDDSPEPDMVHRPKDSLTNPRVRVLRRTRKPGRIERRVCSPHQYTQGTPSAVENHRSPPFPSPGSASCEGRALWDWLKEIFWAMDQSGRGIVVYNEDFVIDIGPRLARAVPQGGGRFRPRSNVGEITVSSSSSSFRKAYSRQIRQGESAILVCKYWHHGPHVPHCFYFF